MHAKWGQRQLYLPVISVVLCLHFIHSCCTLVSCLLQLFGALELEDFEFLPVLGFCGEGKGSVLGRFWHFLHNCRFCGTSTTCGEDPIQAPLKTVYRIRQ